MKRRKIKVLATKLDGKKGSGPCSMRRPVLARRPSPTAPPAPDYSGTGYRNPRPSGVQGRPQYCATQALPSSVSRDDSSAADPQSARPLAEKVKDLVRLAREQGFLSNSDVHE